jgi:hypothetical protein
MEIPPFPDKKDILLLLQNNSMHMQTCMAVILLISVASLCHDLPPQYTKTKAAALVLMQVIMISPYILWDGSTPFADDLTSGYLSWIEFLWTWYDNVWLFQCAFALLGVCIVCKKQKSGMEHSIGSLTPIFDVFIEYLDNDMEKSMLQHLEKKFPMFIISIVVRACEKHAVPLMSSACVLYHIGKFLFDIAYEKHIKTRKKKTC